MDVEGRLIRASPRPISSVLVAPCSRRRLTNFLSVPIRAARRSRIDDASTRFCSLTFVSVGTRRRKTKFLLPAQGNLIDDPLVPVAVKLRVDRVTRKSSVAAKRVLGEHRSSGEQNNERIRTLKARAACRSRHVRLRKSPENHQNPSRSSNVFVVA